VPIVDEVGAIIVRDGNDYNSNERDIIVRAKDGQLRWISTLHPSYSPLHYILFPDGRDGWHTKIPLNGFILDENAVFVNDGEQAITSKGGSKRMTQMQFYAYMLQVREGEHWILKVGRLL
jgi:outer membrane protein assembly factor BamB